MRPNTSIIAPLQHVAEVAQFMDLPKGELFTVAMNPWNGNFIFRFQNHPDARFFIRLIIGQLAEMADMFDATEHGEPNCGLVDYEDEERYREMYGSYPLRRRKRGACVSSSLDDLEQAQRERTVA